MTYLRIAESNLDSNLELFYSTGLTLPILCTCQEENCFLPQKTVPNVKEIVLKNYYSLFSYECISGMQVRCKSQTMWANAYSQ